MIWVLISQCQRVAKHSRRFVERDSVFSGIPRRFERVPFKIHSSILLQQRQLRVLQNSERTALLKIEAARLRTRNSVHSDPAKEP